MATPYNQISGGTLPLPRVHIPSWFNIQDPSENSDALLNLDLLKTDIDTAMYNNDNISDSTEYTDTKILNLGGVNNINDTTNNNYKGTISIGIVPPRQGSIIAYSNDEGTILDGTNSAHILYFEHASLSSFNFAIVENYVIQRIGKLYRSFTSVKNNGTLTTLTDPDTTYDMPDTSSRKMVIDPTNESDAVVASGTTILTLVEGGH